MVGDTHLPAGSGSLQLPGEAGTAAPREPHTGLRVMFLLPRTIVSPPYLLLQNVLLVVFTE